VARIVAKQIINRVQIKSRQLLYRGGIQNGLQRLRQPVRHHVPPTTKSPRADSLKGYSTPIMKDGASCPPYKTTSSASKSSHSALTSAKDLSAAETKPCDASILDAKSSPPTTAVTNSPLRKISSNSDLCGTPWKACTRFTASSIALRGSWSSVRSNWCTAAAANNCTSPHCGITRILNPGGATTCSAAANDSARATPTTTVEAPTSTIARDNCTTLGTSSPLVTTTTAPERANSPASPGARVHNTNPTSLRSRRLTSVGK